MCTLIVIWRMFEEAPLLVAANRDERLDRPAEAPTIRTHENRRFLAPTDVSAGGSWLGLNEAGAFVGLTNRFPVFREGDVRSRGLLVLDALASGTAAEIDERVRTIDPTSYDGFHLIAADRSAAFLIWNDGGDELRHRILEPGISIVTEQSEDASATDRGDAIRQKLPPERMPSDPELLASLQAVTASRPEFNYGTRSRTLIRLGPTDTEMFLHADGPDATLVDYLDLARKLG